MVVAARQSLRHARADGALRAGEGAELGFVAGVALHRAAQSVTGLAHPALALKWPNDLLLGGAKCAGLLLEGAKVGGAFRVLIGFGVNLVSAPADTPYPAGALVWGTGGCEAPASTFLQALSAAWVEEEAHWRQGFATTRTAWLARAAFLGERITVRPPTGEMSGVMRGIDERGRLLLEQDGRVAVVDAGDVAPA